MTLEHEKIMIKSFYDIPKLSKKYTRILRIALVAQESDVSGRFKTVCIRGVGYLSANPKTHLENKNDNMIHLSSVSIERYGVINNINDLESTLNEHYRSPKDHHVNDWRALRDYLEMECGRASHVFGYAELRPTHAQIMAARKGKTEAKPKRNTETPTAKKNVHGIVQKVKEEQKSEHPIKSIISKTHSTPNTALSYIPKGYNFVPDKPAPNGYIWIAKYSKNGDKLYFALYNHSLKKATPASRVKTARKLLDEGRLQTGHVTRLGVKKQTPPASKSRAADRQRKAMLPGYRVSQSGNLYYETRGNRSDTPKERRDFAHAAIHSRRGTRFRRARLGISRDVFLPKYSLKVTPNDTPDAGTKGVNYLPADKIKKGKVLTEAAQMEIVKTIARRYNKSDIEYAFVVDKYGNVLYISKGTAKMCGNPPLKWWKEHKDERLIHVHNHPGFSPHNNWHGVTSTFSRGDFKMMALTQCKQYLVTGYNGSIHSIKANQNFDVSKSTLTRMYSQANSYAQEAINSDPEVIKSSEEMKKALEKIEAGDTVAIKTLKEKHEKLSLQKLVNYEVKKYKELFSKYKGGTVLKWIEDHL